MSALYGNEIILSKQIKYEQNQWTDGNPVNIIYSITK